MYKMNLNLGMIDYTARLRREKSRHYSRVNNFSNGKW